MAAYLNIQGLTPIDDPEYRYKMPRLVTKIEGRGNGIKTLVVNCSDVAISLHRSTGELNKFFGCELGAQSKYDDKTDRALVNGAFDSNVMQTHLQKYIELFVLCPNCRLPETKYKFKGQTISHKCNACGAVEPIDMNHRLTAYVLKEHASLKRVKKDKAEKKEARKAKKKKEQQLLQGGEGKENHSHSAEEEKVEKKKVKKHKKKKGEKGEKGEKEKQVSENGDEPVEHEVEGEGEGEGTTEEENGQCAAQGTENDNITWHTDLSTEAVEKRKHEAERLEPKNNGFTAHFEGMNIAENEETISTAIIRDLKEYLHGKEHSMNEVIEEVVRQQTFHALPVNDRLSIFIAAALDQNVIQEKQIDQYASVFQHLVYDNETQCILTNRIEDFCFHRYPSLKASFPILLKLFYDADVLDEDVIITWSNCRNGHGYSNLTETEVQQVLTSMKPLVEWLKNAEEEESDEEEN